MKVDRLMAVLWVAALWGAAALFAPLDIALAHGPAAFPGTPPAPAPVPPPPVFTPTGGGNTTRGPVGGGQSTPEPAGGASGPEAPAAPQGPGVGGGGATAPSEPASAPTPAPPVGGATLPTPTLPTNPTGPGIGQTPRSGARGQLARPKSQVMPWTQRVRIDWQPVFPFSRNGYAPDIQNPAAGLRAKPEEGGWVRKDRPSLLVVWDPTSKEHQRALARLEDDARVKHAAHLFNCFRMDARALGRSNGEITLGVFDIDGKAVGEASGHKRLRKVYSLLEKAIGRKGPEFSKLTAYVQALLNAIAYCDHQMDHLSRHVICIDCGHERVDIAEAITKMEERKQTLGRALAKVQDQ